MEAGDIKIIWYQKPKETNNLMWRISINLTSNIRFFTKRLFEKPDYDMSVRYALILQTMYATAFYAPLIPFGLFFSCIGLTLLYWAEKVRFFVFVWYINVSSTYLTKYSYNHGVYGLSWTSFWLYSQIFLIFWWLFYYFRFILMILVLGWLCWSTLIYIFSSLSNFRYLFKHLGLSHFSSSIHF